MLLGPSHVTFDNANDIGSYMAMGGVPTEKSYQRLKNAILDINDPELKPCVEIKIPNSVLYPSGGYNPDDTEYNQGYNKGYRQGVVDTLDGVYETRKSVICIKILAAMAIGTGLLASKISK